jgi:hypothetical protein
MNCSGHLASYCMSGPFQDNIHREELRKSTENLSGYQCHAEIQTEHLIDDDDDDK